MKSDCHRRRIGEDYVRLQLDQFFGELLYAFGVASSPANSIEMF